MSRNYKFHNPEGLYFISFAVVGWLDVFKAATRKDSCGSGGTYRLTFKLPPDSNTNTAISYLYRADGTKLRKKNTTSETGIHSTTTEIHTTDYLDGFVYLNSERSGEISIDSESKVAMEREAFSPESLAIVAPPGGGTSNAVLQFVPTAEGFYDFKENKYIYQYKDHLGNTRVSYAWNTTTNSIDVLDKNDYYPFGMNHLDPNAGSFFGQSSFKNYKYNGKELQETGMYDYGARFYMPDIGRWGVVDPLAEKARRFSPYTYASNDPIGRLDPDGRFDTKFGAWLHKTFNGGGSQIRQNQDSKQYYYDQRRSNGTDSNGGIVMNAYREYGKNSQSSSLTTQTSTIASKTDIIPQNSFVKFDHTSATTQGKSGLFNKDIKTTNNVSTGRSEISTDLQINTPQVNSNLEIAPSSVTSGGSISILPGTSIGASVTISHGDVLNSDVSVNFGQNVGNNTTNTLSAGIKPIGIIMVVAAVVAERFFTPIPIGGLQPQLNTVVPPSN